MDYRSPEAAFINSAFMRRQMEPVVVDGTDRIWAYINTAQNSLYARTVEDRLLRIDVTGDVGRINILSADRQSFDPAVGKCLGPGEHLDKTRNFSRYHLVPRQTNGQFLRHDVLPRVGLIGISLLTGSIVGYGVRWAIGGHGLWGHTAASATGAAAGAHVGADHHQHVDEHHVMDSAHSFDAGRNGDVPHDHMDPAFHAAHHHGTETHADNGSHTVPGTPEHPIVAPNGVALDGTPESAARAMLPSLREDEASAHIDAQPRDLTLWIAEDEGSGFDYDFGRNEPPPGGFDLYIDPFADDDHGHVAPHGTRPLEYAIGGVFGGVMTYCVAKDVAIPAARDAADAIRRRYVAYQESRRQNHQRRASL